MPRPAIIPIGPSIPYIPLTQGLYALIDKDDAVMLGQWRWNASCKQQYATRSISIDGSRKMLYLHRLLLPTQLHVDHKNGNSLDNRRSNIRPATVSQNLRNKRIRIDNTLGVIGVTKHLKGRKVWQAWVRVDGRKKSLGYYGTIEEASEARRNGEKLYYGEWARKQ